MNPVINGKTVAFLTLGCKVNSYETEGMRELFKKAGAIETEFHKKADIYIVNTCSVTNMADRKSRQMLHRAKKKNSAALIVAAGCYAQAAGTYLSEEEGIDLVVGNNNKAKIVELTAEALAKKEEKLLALLEIGQEREYEELPIETVTERTRAYIKIEDGCNQFCSYCIIPYVRGRVRSRAEEDILEEIRRLSEAGYREVVLTGIHLSSYGLDKGKQEEVNVGSEFDETLAHNTKTGGMVLPLLSLIKKVQEIEGIERIRLGSLEPRIMTEAFVKELSKLTKVCPHFHLSLQSGCDATLKRMNRKYTAAEYKQAVEYLRRYFENPAITTDVIVGFPGETEEEFSETIRFVDDIRFAQIHIFKYSNRAGTVADKMVGQVPEQQKTERSDVLEHVEKTLREAYEAWFVGRTEEVLFEERVEEDGTEYAVGHTTRYTKVFAEVQKGTPLPNETRLVLISGEKIKDGVLGQVCML